jgi:CelD/BcsL family acetyltransferase involved in cellulose biosynthesis
MSRVITALQRGDEVLAVALVAAGVEERPDWRDLDAAGLRWPVWSADWMQTRARLGAEVLRLRERHCGEQGRLWA